MVDVTGIVQKLANNADKLGALAGFFVGTPNGINDTISALTNAAKGNIHVPDIQGTVTALMNEGNVTKGITLAIAGYVIDAVDPPLVGKWGKALEKGGIGYALGSAAIKLLWMSTHADLGSDPLSPNHNPNAWMGIYGGNSGAAPSASRGYAY